jgi:hypothetical protein
LINIIIDITILTTGIIFVALAKDFIKHKPYVIIWSITWIVFYFLASLRNTYMVIRRKGQKNKYDITNYNGFTPTEICNNLKIKSAPRFRSSVFYQNILYLVGRYDIIPYILQDLRKKRAKKEQKLLNNA